jgi:circadian clock protein KaiC
MSIVQKVPTGIPNLDKIVGGGFTRNNIITISGSTGSGRTIFGIQFLANGAYEYDEKGMYISFSEPKYSLFANMSSFIFNLPELEKNKKVIFIEYPHNELDQFLEKENAILELIDTLGVQRLVLDPIGPLFSFVEPQYQKIHMQKLINIIRKWGVTTIITADDLFPADPNIPRTDIGIENLSDGFIHLGWKIINEKRMRILEVIKMRGSAHKHGFYEYEIDNNGIKITREIK